MIYFAFLKEVLLEGLVPRLRRFIELKKNILIAILELFKGKFNDTKRRIHKWLLKFI